MWVFIRLSGYFTQPSSRVHAGGPAESNTAAYYPGPRIVAPGTIIHSDERRAYSRVARLPAVAAHGVVNQSVIIVDLLLVCTCKMRSQGQDKAEEDDGLPCSPNPHLHEFMWPERYMGRARGLLSIAS